MSHIHRSRRLVRMDKETYQKLLKMKKKTNEDRAGKVFKDKNGRVYQIDENGSMRKMTIEEVVLK